LQGDFLKIFNVVALVMFMFTCSLHNFVKLLTNCVHEHVSVEA